MISIIFASDQDIDENPNPRWRPLPC